MEEQPTETRELIHRTAQDYILGLDIGIGSCGWAILDQANNRIVDGGVRLWSVPQESKSKESLAQKRRGYRSARRNHARTKNRKKHCIQLLIEYGLIPEGSSAEYLQTKKKDRSPIQLRAEGLDRVLTDRELAQVLYSLCCHRGYINHGSDGTTDAEDGKVLSALKANSQAMTEGGYRTIGEYLAAQPRHRNRDGNYNYCVRIEEIEDEIMILFEAQRELGNEKALEELRTRYIEVLTWQKQDDAYDEKVYSTVGECTYFAGEKRAAKSTLTSEMVNAYEKIGHIRVITGCIDDTNTLMLPEGANPKSGYALASEDRRWAFEQIFGDKGKGQLTYKQLRKHLNLSAHSKFKGVREDDEKSEKIYEAKYAKWLMKMSRKDGKISTALYEKIMTDHDLADEIGEALTYASSRESLQRRCNEKLASFGLSDSEMEEITGLPFGSKLFKAYGRRSKKALDMLYDMFADGEENVLTLFDAEAACGLAQRRMEGDGHWEKGDTLPAYSVFDPTCKNPVVLRAMAQVRKVVNAIFREYGVMDIHIELARKMSQSKAEKTKMEKRAKEKKSRDTVHFLVF